MYRAERSRRPAAAWRKRCRFLADGPALGEAHGGYLWLGEHDAGDRGVVCDAGLAQYIVGHDAPLVRGHMGEQRHLGHISDRLQPVAGTALLIHPDLTAHSRAHSGHLQVQEGGVRLAAGGVDDDIGAHSGGVIKLDDFSSPLRPRIDTFTGLTLLMTQSEPWPAYAQQHHTWGLSPLTDLHWGGATMWIGGDTIMIALILTALVPVGARSQSVRPPDALVRAGSAGQLDLRLAAQQAGGATRSSARNVDDDQERLDAYNAWLAEMAARDRRLNETASDEP